MKFMTAVLVVFGLKFLISVQSKHLNAKYEITPFITKGDVAGRTQFPYQVAIYGDKGGFTCGGSLISHQWVITAAHCIDKTASGIYVQLGAWNRTDDSEKGNVRYFVPINKTIVHDDLVFHNETVLNDVALVKLPQPVKFNQYIHSIELPKQIKPYPSYVGDNGVASGWGLLSDIPEIESTVLHWVSEPIIDNSYCAEAYNTTVGDKIICIDTKSGKSHCFGDSGGPFVLNGPKPVLIGITSFVGPNCLGGYPAGYTRVTSYLDWIKKHMNML